MVQIAAGRTLTEVDVDEFLTGKRAAQGGFIEPSFPTIAGSGPNGAIIHYRAQPDTCNTVSASQLLLVDSGEPHIMSQMLLVLFTIGKLCTWWCINRAHGIHVLSDQLHPSGVIGRCCWACFLNRHPGKQ